MTKEIATVSAEQLALFDAETGADAESLAGGGAFIPTLKVQYEEPEDDTKPNHKGKFFVVGQEPEVFAKSVKFRPLLQNFQWTQYDKVQEKIVNRTRFITSIFNDEARDEKGTVKCGKPSSKDLKADPKLAEQYDDITTYRNLHGLVSYTGEDANGNKVTVENVVATLRLKGANFSPFQDEFIAKMPKNTKLYDYEIELSTKKEKNGASTYYVIHFDTDFANRVPMTGEVLETAIGLKDHFDAVNREIDKAYYKAVELRNKDDDAIGAIEGSTSALERDLDDDIPF